MVRLIEKAHLSFLSFCASLRAILKLNLALAPNQAMFRIVEKEWV
jgi:hypothetical protein